MDEIKAVSGGNYMVIVTDESLLPDDVCNVHVTMSASIWSDFLVALSKVPGVDPAVIETLRTEPVRVPVLSRILEALNKPCRSCDKGLVFNPHEPGPEINENSIINCPDCNGTGRASVAGTRLGDWGEAIEEMKAQNGLGV